MRPSQDASDRRALRTMYNGKMWADEEQKGQPNKWVTLRALRVLKHAGMITPTSRPLDPG